MYVQPSRRLVSPISRSEDARLLKNMAAIVGAIYIGGKKNSCSMDIRRFLSMATLT
jgi:hypothetical protein